jgi:hypothetical protein
MQAPVLYAEYLFYISQVQACDEIITASEQAFPKA